MEEHASNSNKSRNFPEKREATAVVNKPADQREPGLVSKLISTFIHEDIRSVKTYLWKDILSPALKRSAVEAVKMFLHVDSPSMPSGSNSKTSYYDYYEKRGPRRGAITEHPSEERRIVHDYMSTRFHSRSDAEAVKAELESIIEASGYTTINDFYVAASMEPRDYTYDNWGWGDLRGAVIKSEYSYKDACTYYCLKLPHAHPVGVD